MRRPIAIVVALAAALLAASPGPLAAAVVSEGVDRSGAVALAPLADGCRGLTIAILDLGFGATWPARQAAGELPQSNRLELASFDPVGGIVGSNAYGDATNHGELVAQTVYDYAPAARYLFVSYHTPQEFVAAVDWLTTRRPDIVVHSNNFLEGPFDGTSAPAQAVDRAAAAGILWFNSAGNYALNHWTGSWSDADGDGFMDWPNGDVWAFPRTAAQPITFALSWTNPPGAEPTDLDLVLERQNADGGWTPVAASGDPQTTSGPEAERITGYRTDASGLYRLRARLAAGPPPAGPLTLFSREIALAPIGATAAGTPPTPGDAAGSLTVGAVDWRGDEPKNYSSEGPTADGRFKPELVAPTNTHIAGPAGPREVGGTSIAAPNAAGAAAVLWAAQRARGLAPTAAVIRQQLLASALDLGPPGPDPVFGHGRVRVDTGGPALAPALPARGQVVRRAVEVLFTATDPTPIASHSLALDGVPLVPARAGDPRPVRVDTRTLADGVHVLQAEARDWTGNPGFAGWSFTVDNTPPAAALRRVQVDRHRVRPLPGGAGPLARARHRAAVQSARAERTVTALVDASDASGRALSVDLRLLDRRGRTIAARTLRARSLLDRALAVSPVPPGRYRLVLSATDAAGNVVEAQRRVTVR
ncbi:MAG: hypothetical protein QOK40_2159 [Miltoncostaeaceae bacterium]|nr:hypothetical protein [Miltoncostaeaceae bacterium]